MKAREIVTSLGYVIDAKLSSTSAGQVYLVNNRQLVVKVTTYDESEHDFYRIAAREGFGVRVIETRLHCKRGIAILEAWPQTLRKWLQTVHTKEHYVQLKQLLTKRVKRMHSCGIVHGDLLPKNILVRSDDEGNLTELAIIDFGLSFWADHDCEYHIERLYEYIFNPNHWYFALAANVSPSLSKVQENPKLLDRPMLVLARKLARDSAFRERFHSEL